MSKSESAAIKTWFREETEEDAMHEDHAYLWRHFLATIPEQDFRQSKILDYGCNRGGFLRTMFEQRPFNAAVGVDVAQQSLEVARRRCADLPVTFMLPTQLPTQAASVDVAFSHEVLYLLPDLAAHARAIAEALKETGVYYAAIGCHTANPLWPRWRDLIAETTHLPVFDYSLDDYARAFWNAGMTVMMRPFQLTDFVLIKPDNPYFPKAADSLDYHTRVKTIICARKTGGAA